MSINAAVRDFSVNHRTEKLIQLVPELKKKGGQELGMALLIVKMLEDSDSDMQSELGDCYYYGSGVSVNAEKALEMFQKADAKGSVRAQYGLGWYYYDRNEYLQSIDYFAFCISNKSELHDDEIKNCYVCLGDAYSRISEPKMSTAIEYLAIAADKFHEGYACRRLAIIYEKMGKQYFDSDRAIKYYEQGAAYGDALSAHALARKYIGGDENLKIKKSYYKAANILKPFADADDECVLFDLGWVYQHGDEDAGMQKDYVKSKNYYERSWAIEQDPVVAANLGYVYFCLSEYSKAESMLITADKAGVSSYSDFLGRMYKEGMLGAKDLNSALFYYGRAYESDELNNIFTCGEYAELLEETGNYQKAYEVAEKGEKKFNDVWFVFFKAKLVLGRKVTNRIARDKAAGMLKTCTRYDTLKKEAYMMLGEYYYSVCEYRKAENQYLTAFDLGVADAAACLGMLYENGGGTIKADVNKAVEWYIKAAEAGSVRGKQELDCFKKGLFGGYRRIRSM